MLNKLWLSRVAVLLCLCCYALTTSAAEPLSLRSAGQPMGVALGEISSALDMDIICDHRLLDAQPIWMHLNSRRPAQVMQALAHARSAWWWGDSQDNHWYLHADLAIEGRDPLVVRAYSSSLIQRPDLDAVVRAFMRPWLQRPGSGLASVPWTGQWTASLDRQGHVQLNAILTRLEQGDYQVPSLLPSPDKPRDLLRRILPAVDIQAESWPQALIALAERWNISISLDPGLASLRSQQPVSLQLAGIEELRDTLVEQGFYVRWIDAVLCLGLLPPQRRIHPALRRRFAVIPLSHLHERHDGQLIATALRRQHADIDWKESGRVCLFIDNPARLLLVAEDFLINDLLDSLDVVERGESLSR